MMTLIAKYSGKIDIEKLFDVIHVPDTGVVLQSLPIREGQIISVIKGQERKGPKKKGRSDTGFRSAICIDASVDGININFKIAKEETIHMVGCKSWNHAKKAFDVIVDNIKRLVPECEIELVELILAMANYRYKLTNENIKIDLDKVSSQLKKLPGFSVNYDPVLQNIIVALYDSGAKEIRKGKSRLHKIKIKQDASVIHYGPDILEIETIHKTLIDWFSTITKTKT